MIGADVLFLVLVVGFLFLSKHVKWCLLFGSFFHRSRIVPALQQLALAVTRPLLLDESMEEDHGAHKPGNSPAPGLEFVKREKFAKKRATQRVSSWTVQNEMRSVLSRMTAGAA